jgi:hypothetical protein
MMRIHNRVQALVHLIFRGRRSGRSQERPEPAQIPARMDCVRDTFEAIGAALGDEYTIDDLLLLLQKVYRKKDLLIERIPMPADQGGECRALLDTDLIRLEEDLDEAQRHMVLLHEMSHLFLDHIFSCKSPCADGINCALSSIDDATAEWSYRERCICRIVCGDART